MLVKYCGVSGMKNKDVVKTTLRVSPRNGTMVKWKKAPTKNAKNTPALALSNKIEPSVPRTLFERRRKREKKTERLFLV